MVNTQTRVHAPRHFAVALTITVALTIVVAGCGSSSSKQADATSETTAVETAADGHSHHHEAGKGDDRGLGMLHNGHHEQMTYAPLSAEDQTQLDALLVTSRQVAAQYPTLGEAIDAGFTRAGPYSPGLGIHYTAPWATQGLNPDGVMTDDDAAHPMIVIFDGTERSAKVAGFMYYSFAADQPAGFPGANDTWHYHTNTCLARAADGMDAPLGADTAVDPAKCKELGGVTMEKTQWMVHVWSVPGYEVDEAEGGVFAEVNAKLACPDGTYFTVSVDEMPAHRRNVCKSAPA